jgi:hypothetical protein
MGDSTHGTPWWGGCRVDDWWRSECVGMVQRGKLDSVVVVACWEARAKTWIVVACRDGVVVGRESVTVLTVVG